MVDFNHSLEQQTLTGQYLSKKNIGQDNRLIKSDVALAIEKSRVKKINRPRTGSKVAALINASSVEPVEVEM